MTGLALSPDGSYVLSNSMDNSLRVWDIRPFAPQERCIKMMVGHAHNFEKVFIILSTNPCPKSSTFSGCLSRTYFVALGLLMETKSRPVLRTASFTSGIQHLAASFINFQAIMGALMMLYSTRKNQLVIISMFLFLWFVNLILMCRCIFLVASGASDKQIYLGEIEP